MVTLKSHSGVFVVVGTRGETVGLELTWAHNLFVEWASLFPTLGRSRQRDSKQYTFSLPP